MARLFEISELQARKRELLLNSEIYRQTLRGEINNVRLAARATIQRKLSFARLLKPGLLGLAAPLASWLFFRKHRQQQRRAASESRRLPLQGLWKDLLMRGISFGVARILQKR